MQQASRLAPGISWAELSLVLTDDSGIQSINLDYLERADVTDVLSFHYDPMPGDKSRHSAEIIVNVEEAVRVGKKRHDTSPSRELAVYVAHGCHHLVGAQDNTPARRQAMIEQELHWLLSAGELPDDLLGQPGP